MTLHSYHDSVPSPAHLLPGYEAHCKGQEADVLRFFRARYRENFSREQIEAAFNLPTQSASRVLANLTARHAIEKSGEYVMSSMGRRANTWRLARPSPGGQGRLAL